ncbi:SLC41A2 isoform 9, partial [Pan troglodytes]
DDYANYNYCDGRETSETTAMLQDEDISSDGDEDAIVEVTPKLPKESSGIMALQILVPFLLAGFGTVSAGMVLDIVQVNIGKMDSPIEKWNLIIGNLALKQVQATVVGFLAAVAAIILGWIPEGKYYLDHSILLCSSSVATAFIASLLQ